MFVTNSRDIWIDILRDKWVSRYILAIIFGLWRFCKLWLPNSKLIYHCFRQKKVFIHIDNSNRVATTHLHINAINVLSWILRDSEILSQFWGNLYISLTCIVQCTFYNNYIRFTGFVPFFSGLYILQNTFFFGGWGCYLLLEKK